MPEAPGILSTQVDNVSRSLTREDFEAAVNFVTNQPPPAPHGTEGNPHLVSAKVKQRLLEGHSGRCIACGAILEFDGERLRLVGF